MNWSWEIGSDAEEIHELLCASDRYSATPDAPAPQRKLATTEARIRSGGVHVLRKGSEAVAAFTLTWEQPFTQDISIFPSAHKAAYISRLAVRPEQLSEGEMLGMRCLRKAVELAETAGADALRSEANPDLLGVFTLLRKHGFEEHFRTRDADGTRRAYLQKNL